MDCEDVIPLKDTIAVYELGAIHGGADHAIMEDVLSGIGVSKPNAFVNGKPCHLSKKETLSRGINQKGSLSLGQDAPFLTGKQFLGVLLALCT